MDIRVLGYHFREMTNLSSRLVYTVNGNAFYISFNIENSPYISRTFRTIGANPIPGDILEEFLFNVMETYPAGFHSRNDKDESWLTQRFSELVSGSIFQLDEPLDACGGITVNKNYLDAYLLTLSFQDKSIKIKPEDCIVAADMTKRKMYFFRYFAESADLGQYKSNKILKIYPYRKLKKTDVDLKHHLVFFDDIVAVTIYTYDTYNNMIRSEVAVRNDIIGADVVSTLGRYIITGGYEYS